MGITVAEKNHWKERIAHRIEQRIESLVAKVDPTLLQRVSDEARKKAYESLGIQAQQQELEAIQKEKEKFERSERRLLAEQKAVIEPVGIGILEQCVAPIFPRHAVISHLQELPRGFLRQLCQVLTQR